MKSGTPCEPSCNGMMAISMALMTVSALITYCQNPSALRLAFVPVMALLCIIYTYQVWRDSRVH